MTIVPPRSCRARTSAGQPCAAAGTRTATRASLTQPGSTEPTASSSGTTPAKASRVQAGSTRPGSLGRLEARRVAYPRSSARSAVSPESAERAASGASEEPVGSPTAPEPAEAAAGSDPVGPAEAWESPAPMTLAQSDAPPAAVVTAAAWELWREPREALRVRAAGWARRWWVVTARIVPHPAAAGPTATSLRPRPALLADGHYPDSRCPRRFRLRPGVVDLSQQYRRWSTRLHRRFLVASHGRSSHADHHVHS